MVEIFLVWIFMIDLFLVWMFLDSIGRERAAAVTIFLGLTFIAAVCVWGIL